METNRDQVSKRDLLLNQIANHVMALTIKGEVAWDFSNFQNDIFQQMAEGKYGDLTFVSSHEKDGTEFFVYLGAGDDKREVESFKGIEARRIREMLKSIYNKNKKLSQEKSVSSVPLNVSPDIQHTLRILETRPR